MFQKSMLTSLLVFAAGAVDAQVPHVFQPNQPARAAEVNDNFTALASGLDSVSNRVAAIEQSSGVGSEYFPVGQVRHPVGSNIVVNGTTYTIVQLNVPKLDSDETWKIRFPTSDPDLGGSGLRDGEGVRLTVTGVNPARPTLTAQGGYHTELNGFKAHIVQTMEYWHYNQGLATSRWNGTDFMQVTHVQIEFGPETLVQLELWGVGMKSTSRTSDMSSGILDNPTFPFVPPRNVRNSHWQAHDELLSYIWLER